MGVLCRTANVRYSVVETKHCVNGNEYAVYGVEGTDGVEVLLLTALSYDYDRVKNLVEDMNKGQFALCFVKEVVSSFFKNNYGIDLN